MRAVQLTFTDRKLTHSSLERALRGAKSYTKSRGWSPKALESGILINLSKVEWFDLSATVRLILFVESAVRATVHVKVVLPAPNPRGSEQACLEEFESKRWNRSVQELRRRIERRSRARDFLKYIDFEFAISCPHLQPIENVPQLIEDYDLDESTLIESSDEDKSDPFLSLGVSNETDRIPEEVPSHDPIYEHILPLRWVRTPDLSSIKQELDSLHNFLIGIVAGKHRGILRFDAEAFANVIFHELIQNTREHAGVSHCLVGAWCRKPGQHIFLEEYHQQEHSFFNQWIKPNRFPLVDIAIGDSGIGIPASLNEAFNGQPRPHEGVPKDAENSTEEVLFWSLGRWTTRIRSENRLRRGTRGLHRVHRLVKGYAGLLTLRAETSLVGWNHGGHDIQESFHQSGLPRVPGTSLSIRLPVITKTDEPIKSPPVEDRMMDFTLMKPLDINVKGLSIEAQDDLAEKLSRGPAGKHRCVVAILQSVPDDPDDRKEALGNAFEQMKNLVSPGALTVLAPGISPDDLYVHIDSFTQEVDEAVQRKIAGTTKDNRLSLGSSPEYYDITDLFSVVDANLDTLWTGGDINEVTLLDALQQSSESRIDVSEIEKLFPDGADRQDVLGDLMGQPDLFRFYQDGSVSLRFNTSDVYNYIRQCVSDRLEDILDDPQQIGVDSNGPFLSPSLIYVNKWLSMNRVLTSFGWFWITNDLLTRLRSAATKNELSAVEEMQEKAIPSFQHLRAMLETLLPTERVEKLSHTKLAKAAYLPFGSDYVLWALAATITQDPAYRPERILCDSLVHEGGAERLATFLGISEQYTVLPRLSLLGELPELWEDFAGKKVLVFCDLILSGNSPRQVLEQAVRQGAKPTAIACICDFRENCSNQIEFSGTQIPVVSLLQTPRLVITDSPESFRVIDAVTGQPETGFDELAKTLAYSIDRKVIEKYVSQTSALYFNHFIRPARHGSHYHQYEHFTFYLDADRFFSNAECLDITRRTLWNEINNFLREHGSSSSKSRVLYVSNDEVLAPRALELLTPPNGRSSQPPPIGIRRSGLPENVAIRDRNVVIVDWNAQTGKTISRLMYLAAARGAESVLGVVWLSRMSEEEEHILRSIDRMRVPSLPMQPSFSEHQDLFQGLERSAEDDQRVPKDANLRSVPVRIVFLSQARIHHNIEGNCPICTQRERVLGERGELSRFPTQHLRSFVASQMEGFRAKLLNEARRSTDIREKDCFGVPVTADKAAIMFRFREALDLAMHSTHSRAQVANYLKDVKARLEIDNERALIEAEAVVCLLATELQWFKLPPLHFYELREILCDIAERALMNGVEGDAPQHALIVMRSAHKTRFANAIARLVPSFIRHPTMLMQMLYDSFTMIDAPYHDRATIASLVGGLDSFVKAVAEFRKTEPSDQIEVHATATAVYGLGVRRLGFADSEDANIQASWTQAKEFLNTQLSDAHSTLGKIYRAFQFGAVEQNWEKLRQPISDATSWDNARIKWSECQNLLERRLFRHIRTCWPIFAGPRADVDFDDADIEFLKDICLNPNSYRIRRINDLLSEFSIVPPSPGPKWTEFKAIRSMLFKLILKLGDERTNDLGALTRKFMYGCPTDLMDVIARAQANQNWRDDILPEFKEVNFNDLFVFCHKSIVEEVVEESIRNAEVHRSPEWSDKVRIGISVERNSDSKSVDLLFLYLGTNPEFRDPEQPGQGQQGLKKLEKALEPYSSQIEWGPYAGSEWTYFTRAKFVVGGIL